MATKRQVMKTAEKMGVLVEKNELAETVTLDAPPGHLMAASGCHCVVISYDSDFDHMADVWSHALSDLDEGLADCDEPECEEGRCWELREDRMIADAEKRARKDETDTYFNR